jgi:hypothetical protein
MPKLRALAVLVAASSCACAQTANVASVRTNDALKSVHEALFATFVPVEDVKLDGPMRARFASVRDEIWSSAGQSPAFRQLLLPFADLNSLHGACGIPAKSNAPQSFGNMQPHQREHVISLLSACDENQPRRLAMAAREFYVDKTYAAVQEQIADVQLNLSAKHEWIEQHRPKLPATRLRFDKEGHEIVSTDGEIDYLIVGSGPAGSVLAHELRRGGKRVVLVERGSFLVPGSVETRITGGLLDARTSADGGVIIHNGMTVGGGSQVNVDLCFAPTVPAVRTHVES